MLSTSLVAHQGQILAASGKKMNLYLPPSVGVASGSGGLWGEEIVDGVDNYGDVDEW